MVTFFILLLKKNNKSPSLKHNFYKLKKNVIFIFFLKLIKIKIKIFIMIIKCLLHKSNTIDGLKI